MLPDAMHIVMIAPFALAPKATTSARILPLARALAERGHVVRVLIPPYDRSEDSGRVFETAGVQVIHLKTQREKLSEPIVRPLELAERALAAHPDIIHIFKPVAYSGLAAMYLSVLGRGVPLVLDTDDWEGRGGWADQNRLAPLWRRFFSFQEQWVPRHCAAVTVASRTLETQIWGYGVDPSRVFYLPNCPDPAFLKQAHVSTQQIEAMRRQLGLDEGPALIYTGFIPVDTDLDLLVEAFPRVQTSYPGVKAVILGDGPGLPDLQARVRDQGLESAFVWVGRVPHECLGEYLAAAEVAVYPYRDTLINRAKCSMKIVDYMVAGKAIVGGRVGQNLDYLEHLRSGLLVDPGDPAALADGIIQTLDDAHLRARLGAAARERVESRFRWDVMAALAEKCYARARSK